MQTPTETRTARKQQPSVVNRLRKLAPRRPLSFSDARRIAELQATRLLQLTGCANPPVPEAIITALPRIDARRSQRLNGSGVSLWHQGQWRIRTNALEPFTRQRFSLAHEFKHILDASHEDVIYRHLPIASQQRHTHIEAICDAFAAALLMPKPLVKRYWYAGSHNLTVLAWRFQVSQQAMRIRLESLGLIERQPRPHYSTRSAYWVGRTAVRTSRARHLSQRRRYLRTNASSPTRATDPRDRLFKSTTHARTAEGVSA